MKRYGDIQTLHRSFFLTHFKISKIPLRSTCKKLLTLDLHHHHTPLPHNHRVQPPPLFRVHRKTTNIATLCHRGFRRSPNAALSPHPPFQPPHTPRPSPYHLVVPDVQGRRTNQNFIITIFFYFTVTISDLVWVR
ncbi:hypothetical protein HanHA300_Chr15g0586041 [Helianthus annuus]|nr:hypothetical protein HanHA89_Chr17g0709651 [Helianthus annuus]KAJ0453054.1 hypothetical protein HanHA300_Chr15g0586041 [Helianthus annuus]KAJ0632715.1 hypothetical protein HanLR1_Chr17g0668211 [Helianthus annuus]